MNQDTNNQIYYCRELTIYPQLGQIKTATEDLRLGPVNMGVLVVLLEKQGQVVSRAELFDKVWKNQIISDDVLTRCISDLRALLNKHSEYPKWIETVPKRGYLWLPEVCDSLDNVKLSKIIKSGTSNSQPDLNKNWQYYLRLVTVSIIALMLISTSSLWLIEKWFRSDLIRVALIPIQAEQVQQKSMTSEIDDLLRM